MTETHTIAHIILFMIALGVCAVGTLTAYMASEGDIPPKAGIAGLGMLLVGFLLLVVAVRGY